MLDSFGAALRALREKQGWSLRHCADRLGWSFSHISNIEAGRVQPSSDFAQAVDQLFDAKGTMIGIYEEENDVKRRALLAGMGTAIGVGAVASYAAIADH